MKIINNNLYKGDTSQKFNMNSKTIITFAFLASVIFSINLVSAVIVDAEYVTIYPGEEGTITLDIENNENFDIENIRVSFILKDVPFTSIGTSTKDIDDLDENDDDSIRFTLRPSTDITPGDFDIPYTIKYTNANDNTQNITEQGSFGVRVSAKTDIDFSAETREVAIIGKEGQISLEIVNRGLGEIKSVSVELSPLGFELLSSNKIFIGTIDPDDSDTAVFDVIYKSQNPTLSAIVSYKDFDNIDRVETVDIPIKVYTQKQALQLGLIQKSKTIFYILGILVLIVLWYIWKKIKKRRKKEEANRG